MPGKLRVLVQPGVLRGIGLDDIIDQIVSTNWSASNPPWALQTGENVLDNVPLGVPRYEARSFSNSNDLWTVFKAAEAAMPNPGYIHFPDGTFNITQYQLATTNDWRGYWNSSKQVMGFYGNGADKTFFAESPNMIPSAARAYALNPTDTSIGVTLQNLYMSNNNSPIPLFISGISFDGVFQGPYGVHATSGLTVNTNTASPIAHRGLALWRSIAGARLQYCRFRGFGFTLKASPPYELAGLESNYDNGLVVARTEIDGRETSTGAVSAGGYMINYIQKTTLDGVWIHDTRRSGFAIHEHHNGDNGDYTLNNLQVQNISNTADSFQGSALNNFNATNVEEVTGTMRFTNYRAALDLGYHITFGSSADTTSVAQEIDVTDFTSLSTAYNGCLVVRIIKQPNSLGNSPYWNLYNTGGLGALPFVFKKDGKALTPIASTSYNSSLHTPDKNYIVVTA